MKKYSRTDELTQAMVQELIEKSRILLYYKLNYTKKITDSNNEDGYYGKK